MKDKFKNKSYRWNSTIKLGACQQEHAGPVNARLDKKRMIGKSNIIISK
jgi:hypothetical protein